MKSDFLPLRGWSCISFNKLLTFPVAPKSEEENKTKNKKGTKKGEKKKINEKKEKMVEINDV